MLLALPAGRSSGASSLLQAPNNFDLLIDEFGIDDWLRRFTKNLIAGRVTAPMVSKKLDVDKLCVEVTLLLKLLIQVCINELPFLKQLYSRKEEKHEMRSAQPTPGLKKAKELWEKALAREAVHLLLLNKPNASIDDIKQAMTDSLVKDETLQDQLFAVSDQSRGKMQMVTFKLKE